MPVFDELCGVLGHTAGQEPSMLQFNAVKYPEAENFSVMDIGK